MPARLRRGATGSCLPDIARALQRPAPIRQIYRSPSSKFANAPALLYVRDLQAAIRDQEG
jgi:hypothetical protein